jgi:hypothetical protein
MIILMVIQLSDLDRVGNFVSFQFTYSHHPPKKTKSGVSDIVNKGTEVARISSSFVLRTVPQ